MLPTATKTTTMFSLATFKQWLKVTSNTTKTISSLTSSGTLATATCANHGYATGTFVQIAGATQAAYNGGFIITVLDANTFTYTMSSTTTSPATGTPTSTIDDGRYSEIADAASAEFELETGIPFVKRSVSEVFSGDGKASKALRFKPIVSIDSFTIDGSAVDPTTYVLNSDWGIIYFTTAQFNAGVMNCVLSYTAGYDVQDGALLPSDVVRAGLDLGKAIADELTSNAIAASTVSLGPASMVVKATKRSLSVQRVIDKWVGKGMRL